MAQTIYYHLQNTIDSLPPAEAVDYPYSTKFKMYTYSTALAGAVGNWVTVMMDATRNYQIVLPGLKLVDPSTNPLTQWLSPVKIRLSALQPDTTKQIAEGDEFWMQAGQSYDIPSNTFNAISFEGVDTTTLISFFVTDSQAAGYRGTK